MAAAIRPPSSLPDSDSKSASPNSALPIPSGPDAKPSQPPHDPPASDGSQSAERRPKRGVRHLNEQQLAKKRQNDREAQRAIRERTKNQIEALEGKVRELESGQAYTQLQDLIREKDDLRRENDELKATLASVRALVDSRVGSSSASQDYRALSKHIKLSVPSADNPAASPSSNPSDQRLAAPTTHHPHREGSEGSPRFSYHSPSDHMLIHNSNGHPAAATPSSYVREGSSHHSDRPSSIEYLPDASRSGSQTVNNHSSPQSGPPPLGWVRRQPYSSVHAPYFAAGSPTNSIMIPPIDSPTAYAQIPNNILPTCPYDSILQDFIGEGRKRVAQGLRLDDLIGPPYPDLTALIYPEKFQGDRAQSLSNLLIDVLKGFSNISGWPEKVSNVLMVFYFVRWLILPTKEHYMLLPEFLRPMEEQVRVPHPTWVDLLPWPKIRAKLVYQYPSLPLDAFFYPFSLTLSVNYRDSPDPWTCLYRVRKPATQPYDPSRPDDGFTGEIRALPELEQHMRRIENWTLGPAFEKAFPWLADSVFLKLR